MMVEPVANNSFNARMAEGHKRRLGHDLKAVQVSADGILWHTVRLCCGETVPETVPTWSEVIPDKESRD